MRVWSFSSLETNQTNEYTLFSIYLRKGKVDLCWEQGFYTIISLFQQYTEAPISLLGPVNDWSDTADWKKIRNNKSESKSSIEIVED